MKLLDPIKESTEDYEAIEKAIKILFKKEIYLPLLRELDLGRSTIRNSLPGLLEALRRGTVTFNRGVFSGKFNSEITKDLRALGASFDRGRGVYRLPLSDLPYEVRGAISASEARFQERMAKIDRKLADILPEDLAKKLKTGKLFDRTLWRVEKSFQRSVDKLTIAPSLTKEQADRISSEWSDNLQLWISDFTKKEIGELRQKIQTNTFAGDRHGSMVKMIQDSYGVTARKAKFLARQETSLLMAKFKQTRYQAAGVEYYKWGCVKRPHDSSPDRHTPGNVRFYHGRLEGQIFRWDQPPVVDEHGSRKNPQQDYNCRCFARPMVGYVPGKDRK